jgi:hypothetical protein
MVNVIKLTFNYLLPIKGNKERTMRKIITVLFAVALAIMLQAAVAADSQAAPPASGPCGYYRCTQGYYGHGYNYSGYYGGYYGHRYYRYPRYKSYRYQPTYYHNNRYYPRHYKYNYTYGHRYYAPRYYTHYRHYPYKYYY